MIRQLRKNRGKLIFVLILFISIGFAVLTTTLNITGSSTFSKNTWDIHFENIQVLVDSEEQVPVIDTDKKTTVTYNCTFASPGDYYEFSVDVVNDGTIDAMIKNIKSTVNGKSIEEKPNVLEYSVTNKNGTELEERQLLRKKSSKTIIIRVGFKEDLQVSDLPDSDQVYNMRFEIEYEKEDIKTTTQTLSIEKLKSFGESKRPTKLITLDTGVEDSSDSKYTDISEEGDGSILAWVDRKTMYISAKTADTYIQAPKISAYMLGTNGVYTEWYCDLELIDLSYLDVSNTTSMTRMFSDTGYNSNSFKIIGLEDWDVSNVTTTACMFCATGSNAKDWDIGDLSSWDTKNLSATEAMFSGAGYQAKKWEIGNISNWNTSKVENLSSIFSYAGYSADSFNLDLSNWDTSEVKVMNNAFTNAGYNASRFELDLTNWNVRNVTNLSRMFDKAGYNSTAWILKWDTSKVEDMSNMFNSAGKNADYNLDLSNWNVEKVTSHTDFNTNVESKVTPPRWTS